MPPIPSQGSGVPRGPISDDVYNDLLKRAPSSSVQMMSQIDPITHRLTSNAQASTSRNYKADLAEDLANTQVAALGQECRFKWAKETCESHQSNTHVDCESDNSDDEKKGVYVAEFVWPSEAIPYSCSSLKLIQKNRQEKASFTFDVSKCDRIFDELHRNGNIKLSHVIPLLEELKRHAYCKWHDSSSHATNDCNIFH